MTIVRPAAMHDVETVSETVAVAFAAELAWSYMLGEGNLAGMRTFARAIMIPRVRAGTVWVADDCTAVAMWDRRDMDPSIDEEEFRHWGAFRAEVGEEIWSRVAAYDEAVEPLAPERPYWYLEVLATHPDVQGRGLATAVLQPGFEAAADDGWDSWVETSGPTNKRFYERRGFGDAHPVELPNGPATWWLRRPHPS